MKAAKTKFPGVNVLPVKGPMNVDINIIKMDGKCYVDIISGISKTACQISKTQIHL